MGANGFVVVGSFYEGGALHWMPTAGATAIGGVSGIAVSRDGKTIVGRALDSRGLENAAIWLGGQEWRLLGSIAPNAQPCDLLLSGSLGANGDGKVVVGWEEGPDGLRKRAKWVEGREELIKGPTGRVGEAFAANRDGSMIVGTNCDLTDSVGPRTAWTWTPNAGITCFPVRRPPDIPALFYQVLMQDLSDDGCVIGGAFSFGLESQSLVWFDGEVFFLKHYLRANGAPDASKAG